MPEYPGKASLRWARGCVWNARCGTTGLLHRDLGEILVHEGDVGFVLEISRFWSDTYYTVEFVERCVAMAVRANDLAGMIAVASPASNA
jgi:hypothetical protein